MALVKGKDSTIITEASSEPVASNNQTPNSLKAKRKLVKKYVNNSVTSAGKLKDTPSPIQGRKKILKKKFVGGSKTIDKKKDDETCVNGEDVKQEITLIGEQSKTSLENSTGKIGNQILRKKIVARNNIIDKKKEDVQSVDSKDMKQKNVLIGEQSKSNLENFEEESVSKSNKMNDGDDRVDSQNLNGEELKQNDVINEEPNKNNPMNLKKKKKVIVVRKVSNSNNKERSQALNMEESKQKNATNAEKGKKRPEDVKNKEEHDEKNRDNFGGSRNKRPRQNTEDRNGLSRNQQNQKNKEKLSGNDQTRQEERKKHQTEGERKENRNKKVGGVIFFCSGKTKPDCFRYNIMGVSTNRQDLVLSIKPGIKLFLYDFGMKLLYGIYRASSPGGMKLEPAAFNGSFPVQVRFEIYQDCYPLPESVFKRAIEENYNGNNKFDPELTYQQVNKLMTLFKPAELKQLASPVFYPPRSVGREETKEREAKYLAQHHREPFKPTELKQLVSPVIYPPRSVGREETKEREAEYLAQHHREAFKPAELKQLASPVIYPPRSVGREEAKERETEYLAQHQREPLVREPYDYDERRRYDFHLNETDELLTYRRAPSTQRESSPEKLFLSEKDYRTHGLRRERRNVTPPRSHIAPTLELDSRSQGPLLVHPGSTYRYGENEYPASYGHLPRQELRSSAPLENSSTASIVDSYLKVPYYGSSSDLHRSLVRKEREEVALGSYSLGRRETTHQSETSYLPRREIYPTEASYRGGRENHDVGSLYSSYASKALLEYNQQHRSEGTTSQPSLATVSARYSFAGPSRQYQ